MGPMKSARQITPRQVERLRMKKANEDTCACYTVAPGWRVRWCDKHRPTRSGTHGRMLGRG